MSTAALVLAAGSSRRLGEPKQLIDWGGRPLLQAVLDSVNAWPVDEVWVVLGDHADTILETVDFGSASVVINEAFADGLASSLCVGLDAMLQAGTADRCVVALGDQPGIDSTVVASLLEAHRTSGRMAAVPKYRYTWSNPVVLDRALWNRVMSIEGDTGAQQLLKSHPEWVEEVWFEMLPPRDVDTQSDVDELRPRRSG